MLREGSRAGRPSKAQEGLEREPCLRYRERNTTERLMSCRAWYKAFWLRDVVCFVRWIRRNRYCVRQGGSPATHSAKYQLALIDSPSRERMRHTRPGLGPFCLHTDPAGGAFPPFFLFFIVSKQVPSRLGAAREKRRRPRFPSSSFDLGSGNPSGLSISNSPPLSRRNDLRSAQTPGRRPEAASRRRVSAPIGHHLAVFLFFSTTKVHVTV